MNPAQAAQWARALGPEAVILEHRGERIQEYRNFYFDDPALRFFRDHHDGRPRRSKDRFRQYGSGGPKAFEIKHKDHRGRTQKFRIDASANGNQLSEEHCELIDEVTGVDSRALEPVLVIGYQRLLLANPDMTERATIDLGLQARSRERHVSFSPAVIIEIKQQVLDRHSPAFEAMRQVGSRPSSFSKYCAGVASCVAEARSNRFKKLLRKAPPTDLYPNFAPRVIRARSGPGTGLAGIDFADPTEEDPPCSP